MTMVRAHVTLPAELLAGIDALVGERERSRYIAEVLSERLKRDRFRLALEAVFASAPRTKGDWGDEDSVEWVRRQRDGLSERSLRIMERQGLGHVK